MGQRSPVGIALLLLAVLATGWWAWNLRDSEEPPPLIGPPRSDYQVEQFELLAFDVDGKEAFSVRGPRMARHPFLGDLEIEQPRLRMPDQNGGYWQGRSERAWVSAGADVVSMRGKVDLNGPRPQGKSPMRLRSEQLDLRPNENRVESDKSVTVTGPGSILRGLGLRADLDTRRIELLSEVTARYEPTAR